MRTLFLVALVLLAGATATAWTGSSVCDETEAHWKLNDSAYGVNVDDSSGVNDGLLRVRAQTKDVATSGIVGTGGFALARQWVDCGEAVALNNMFVSELYTKWVFSCWIRTKRPSETILAQWGDSTDDQCFRLYINSSGYVQFEQRDEDGVLYSTVGHTSVLGGSNYHIAVAIEPPDAIVYLNTLNDCLTTGTSSTDWEQTLYHLRIGKADGSYYTEGDFVGLLDDLRVINCTDFSTTEIAQVVADLYNSGDGTEECSTTSTADLTYADYATTATYATTAGSATTATSATSADTATTASVALVALTASTVTNAATADYATAAGSAGTATTATVALDAQTLNGESGSAFADASHTHAATDVISGTFSDSRIPTTVTRDTEWNSVAKIETNTGEDIITSDEIGAYDDFTTSSITGTGSGLSVGNLVYLDSTSTWTLADADTTPAMAVVTDNSTIRVQTDNICYVCVDLSGATIGDVLFLSHYAGYATSDLMDEPGMYQVIGTSLETRSGSGLVRCLISIDRSPIWRNEE